MQPSQNDIVLLILITAVVIAVLAFFLISLVIINARRNARRQIETIRTIFETQEEERKRIARDMHDGLGAQLSAIKLYVGLLSEPDKSVNTTISLHSTKTLIDSAMRDLRMITRNLLPRTLSEQGLAAQLSEIREVLNETNNIKVIVSINNEKFRFQQEFEINLFRILQEMINNTLKYAHAKTIHISLHLDKSNLKVEYHDDGTGFDIASVKKGLGIKNIETRVKFYDGKIRMESSPLSGTTYTINFALEQNSKIYA